MDKRTLKALQGSIKKWEKIVAGTGTDGGMADCPLCKLFFLEGESSGNPGNCDKCPATCGAGTTYETWDAHQVEAHGRLAVGGERTVDDCKKCKRLAKAELAFLKGLLP